MKTEPRGGFLISQGHTVPSVFSWNSKLGLVQGVFFSFFFFSRSLSQGQPVAFSITVKWREECFKLPDELTLWEVRKNAR